MGVSRIYIAGAPYNGGELASLDYEQTADTMYFAHIDHAPQKLVRSAHTAWTFSGIDFGPAVAAPTGCSVSATNPNQDVENDGNSYFPQPAAYVVTAVVDESGQESRASNEASASNDLTLKRNYNTVTWTAVAGADRYNIYKAENEQFFGYIGTTEGVTFRDDNIGPALDRAPPMGYNPFAAAGDYPSTVTLFEQRSMWGRTGNAPNAVWGSRSGQLENMDRSRPLRADDSLSFAIIAGQVNSVNNLVATTSLLALTSNAIFNVDGDGSGGTLTADSPPAVRRQIGRGVTRLNPIVVDSVVFYTPQPGRAVRTINYSFELDGLRSNDVSIFSPHFFAGFEIIDWCYAREPRSLIWAVRSDGKLLCFTWEQEQNVWGWTLCETDGLVKSVCCIQENSEDRVYLIVERTVDGAPRRFVERMVSHEWDNLTDTCFMDCAVSGVFDPPQSSFSGLWHLEGREDVVGLVDGHVVEGLTVTGGVLDLPDSMAPGGVVSFGIPYAVEVETMPIKFSGEGIGSNEGRRQQPGDVVLRLFETSTIEAGTEVGRLFPVKQRASEAYGSPTSIFSGVTEPLTMEGRAGTDVSVFIRQTKPLPFTLLGVNIEPIING